MTDIHLSYTAEDVAHIHIDAPPKNLISLARLRALDDIMQHLAHDPRARAAVLTAAGTQFCLGADLTDAALATLTAEDPAALARLGQHMLDTWANLPIPTVVAVQGHAIGAGACLAVAADFRLMTADATLHFPEVERGMYLSWGIIPRIAHTFGPAAAKWLALACAPIRARDLPPLTIQTALPPDLQEAALTTARSLATLPREAAKLTLQTLREFGDSANQAPHDPERFAQSVQHPDFAEAMQRWFNRKA